jgi:hypothetical protein
LPTFRSGRAAAILVAALAACTQSQPAATTQVGGSSDSARVVATFTGQYDPATQKLTITTEPAAAANPGALSVIVPFQDGIPDSSPDNTFEMVTDSSGVQAGGCGAVNSLYGNIHIRSFFRNQTLSNVHVEMTDVTPGDFSACNSTPVVPPGTSSGFGLWDYGTIPPGASAGRMWAFRYATAAAFTFHGRVWADLSERAVLPLAPEFDWSPTALDGPRSFKEVGSTTAHIVWNGSTFVDRLGHITFVPAGAPTSTFSGIPGAPYANGFSGTSYFVADAAHSGNYVDTSGDFTACVKFKPGRHPGLPPGDDTLRKVLFAKGQAEPYTKTAEGWALMQMHSAYCFHYRTLWDYANRPTEDTMTFRDIGYDGYPNPETFAFDYVCGGRNGSTIVVGTHDVLGFWYPTDANQETTTFVNGGADLPLVIGAYPDGTGAATDAGVYEVILDSRPATLAVMNEIVGAAEGRNLPTSSGDPAVVPTVAIYVPPSTTSTVQAADGQSYVLPPYATLPAGIDGTGLLEAGAVVQYLRPLAEYTTAMGYCAGAEVVATGDWASVSGGIMGRDDRYGNFPLYTMTLRLNPFSFSDPGGQAAMAAPLTGISNTAHVVMACIDPTTPTPATGVRLYVDGALTTVAAVTAPLYVTDLSVDEYALHIGQGGRDSDTDFTPSKLIGARIRRVFLCPSPDPSTCH